MKSSVRFGQLPVAGSTGLQQLQLIASVPFTSRADTARSQASLRARGRSNLYRAFLAVIVLCVASTLLAVWYLSHELPTAQRRAKESEALLAPPSHSFCRRTRPPMVCAHGGDTTHAPPNTVSAFRAALAAGVDCVEVDAALARDGVLVVMHVRELAQLLGRGGMQVGDLDSRELLALRWPSGEAVMSVEEAVRLTSPFVSCVTLDVKTYNNKAGQPLDELAVTEALVGLMAVTRCTNCLIWAKSDRVVRRVMELSPGQRTGYIVMNETLESLQLGMHHPLRFSPGAAVEPAGTITASTSAATTSSSTTATTINTAGTDNGPFSYDGMGGGGSGGRGHRRGDNVDKGLSRGSSPPGDGDGRRQQQQQQPGGPLVLFPEPDPRAPSHQPGGWHPDQPAVVGVHFAMVEPQLLELLHGAGKQLFAWTINQAEVLKAVLDVGVDALVTNYPLTALAAIDARLAKCGVVQAAAVQRPQKPPTSGDYL